MNTDCAVCYVSDINFLLPSLVSALSLRRFVPASKADIIIFSIGVAEDCIAACNEKLLTKGIRVQSLDMRVFAAIDSGNLAKTYTPLGTFGRFFMEEFLPAECKRIVYLDGDLLIVGDPTELIEAKIPEGCLAAADDAISFRHSMGFGKTTGDIRSYFSALGLKRGAGYFNAGVFAVSRDTWKTLSKEALSYYLSHMDLCKHFDQSALNAIVSNKRKSLSVKWNFQTQFKIWGADRCLEPKIVHFTKNPKPWMGNIDPWGAWYDHYQGELRSLADLNLPLKRVSQEDAKKANMATKKSYGYLRWPIVSRIALKMMSFKEYEDGAWL